MNIEKELIFERIASVVRLAVVEDGRLIEYMSARGGTGALAGNIYIGRVQNVLPGMNAAFVDIGLNKNAFLTADAIPGTNGEKRIEKLVRPGQLIRCQVSKEPGGSKGPRLTCDITLPGRLCVILPELKYCGVSKKIEDIQTRDELFAAASEMTEETGIGIIVRTAAENETIAALREDYDRAVELWEKIRAGAAVAPGPQLLYADTDLILYTMRELLDNSVSAIRTDDRVLADEIRDAAKKYAPQFADRVDVWAGDIPLFDLLKVDKQLDTALSRHVYLKNGGSLVIDEAEAMTVIDVNTGKFTGKKDIEATILKTNMEAAEEIARQIRLRDIGGIIVIDFIDMALEEDRAALLMKMRDLMATDRNRTAVVEITALGLMELTRKKVRRSLAKRMTVSCDSCHGEGKNLRKEEIAVRCAREIRRRRRGGDSTSYEVRVCTDMIPYVREYAEKEYTDLIFTADDHLNGFEILPVAAEK